MNFTKSGWIFLIVVAIFSFSIISYVKDDSFFGLYNFGEQEFVLSDSENIDVYFCPEDFCADKVIEKINLAEKNIDLAIYSFSLDEIAQALINANKRGVKVRVVFDYLQASANYSVDELIELEGIDIKIRKASGSMHNKFCIIDKKVVLTGSFNYSVNANERNDENLVILNYENIAKEYFNEFEEIWSQSKTRNELK